MVSTGTNTYFDLAVQFVCYTDRHLFLTGKAGTGKTTFLKYIREHCPKKMAIVAPTGVAAINAGGVTIHSLFQLPFGPFIPDYAGWNMPNVEISNKHTLLKNIRLNSSKRKLLQELELLVIDEVSMMRADTLDAMDTVLRHVRKKNHLPFGGIQVVYIGDLYQLPPVIGREEWQLMYTTYRSPFFFDAQVMKMAGAEPLYLELKTIYRQSDESFIQILNNIRNNTTNEQDLDELHKHYDPDFRPDLRDKYILLTSHNARADVVNKTELEALTTKLHVFEGVTKGDFGEKMVPVEKYLLLKEGAQVMFIKNDKGEQRRYYNGKIATVAKIADGKIWVKMGDDEMELEKETWRNINYKYNQLTDAVEEEELGSFTQYPVRLAWAITIHKSQGLTFEKAIVDAGASFAAGQVYVALSRLTSLKGLVLHSRITPTQIMTDARVVDFSSREISVATLEKILQQDQLLFAGNKLSSYFGFELLHDSFTEHVGECIKLGIPGKEEAYALAKDLSEKAATLHEVSSRFQQQLSGLVQQQIDFGQGNLQERGQAACNYFSKALDEMAGELEAHIKAWSIKPRTKKYVQSVKELLYAVNNKKLQIKQALAMSSGLGSGTNIAGLLRLVEDEKKNHPVAAPQEETEKAKAKTEKGSSSKLSLQMYQEGKTIEQIAHIRSMSPGTIEGHLTSFISTGEIDVKEFVSSEQLSAILKVIQKMGVSSFTALKETLGPDYTYQQIRAVAAYQQRLSREG